MVIRCFRRLYRSIAVLLWAVFHGLVSIPIRYLYEKNHCILRMTRQTQIWGSGLAYILGIKVNVHGDCEPYLRNGGLIVANHQSYTDVFVHASVFGARFTPKIEIRNWPVLGWYVDLIRPIWIDRKSKQASANAMQLFRETLNNKIPLIVYPEGTTTDGRNGLLPFKTTSFETVVGTQIPIQPMISLYHPADGEIHPCWVGNAELMPHLWEFLGNSKTVCDIYILPQVMPRDLNRKELAAEVRDLMMKSYEEHFQPDRRKEYGE